MRHSHEKTSGISNTGITKFLLSRVNLHTILIIVPLVSLLLISILVSTTTAIMVGLSTAELSRESTLVIEGEVQQVRAHWSSDGKVIFSRAVVVVGDVVRGRMTGRRVVVEYDGGEVGEMGLKVSDIAPLDEGERVILFLRAGKSRRHGAVFNIVGKGQGKYTIGDDGIARKGGFSIIEGGDRIDNNIPAEVLKDRIRRAR